MATYKEIFGTNIEVLASDPANPVAGQVWYNSTDNVVKGFFVTTAGSWATGGDLNTARAHLAGMGESNTAALAAGGNGSPQGLTESYNGSAWTEVNDLNTARYNLGGAGADNTSALAFGGQIPPGKLAATEEWTKPSFTVKTITSS